MKVNFLVDLSEVFHRILHTGDSSVFGTRVITYLNKMRDKITGLIGDNELNFILVADSQPYWRNTLLPNYKNAETKVGRHKEFEPTLEILKQDYKVLHHEGMEADDLMYLFCCVNPGTIIATSDGDANQTIYMCKAVRYRMVEEEFIDEVNMSFVYKWLLGCVQDSAPRGIPPRIGEVKLAKLHAGQKIDDPYDLYEFILHELGIEVEDSTAKLTYELVAYDLETYNKYCNLTEISSKIDALC